MDNGQVADAPSAPGAGTDATPIGHAAATRQPSPAPMREIAHRLRRENELLKEAVESAREDSEIFREFETLLARQRETRDDGIQVLLAKRGDYLPSRHADRATLAELHRLRRAEASLRGTCASQSTEIARLQAERKELSSRNDGLEKSAESRDNTIRTQAAEISGLREIEHAGRAEIGRQVAEIAGLRESLRAANQAIETLRESLRPQRMPPEEERGFPRRAAELDRAEKRLRAYAAALGREKAEILGTSRRLAAEIQASRALHPLQDYLELTEFELRKIEIHLKTTPTSSSERPRLENAFAQVVEQRDFLRRIVDTSRRELEKQATAILQIAKDVKTDCIPPPPPKAPGVSEV